MLKIVTRSTGLTNVDYFSYAVFKVLEFASKEKNRDLQLKALDTMREIELAINDIGL